VSKAYRAGQFSYTIAPGVSGPAQSGDFIKPVDPEKVINMEGGLRTTWLDGRLRVNPTGYYMAWTNRQTAARVACAVSQTCPLGSNVIIRNSGDIDLYGMELDAQFAVTRNLLIDGGLGTTKYRIHDEVANGGPNLFPPQASPTGNIGATYTMRDLSFGQLALNATWTYTAAQQTYPESTDPAAFSDGAYRLSSYSLLNARIQWTSSSGKNVVSLFGNNLLDKTYGTFATKFGGGFWDTFNPGIGLVPPGVGAPLRNMVGEIRGRPREYGLTLQHNFD
jgi:iron complex outermembrane receptor protein